MSRGTRHRRHVYRGYIVLNICYDRGVRFPIRYNLCLESVVNRLNLLTELLTNLRFRFTYIHFFTIIEYSFYIYEKI